MTANQIAYNKYLEDVRTHKQQEYETQRSNLAREAEQSRANTLNYNASIYASQTAARNAEIAADTQRMAAQLNYAASLNSASVSAETKRYETNVSDTTKRLVSDRDLGVANQKLEEERRHNQVSEKISTVGTVLGAISNAIGAVKGFSALGFLA